MIAPRAEAPELKFVFDPLEKPNPLLTLVLNPGKLMLGPSPSPVLHKSVEHDCEDVETPTPFPLTAPANAD